MPYLHEERKLQMKPAGCAAVTPGDLNYQLTVLVKKFIEYNGLNYTNLNAAIGALECCKLELYRRLAAPYEDKKILENGDVY